MGFVTILYKPGGEILVRAVQQVLETLVQAWAVQEELALFRLCLPLNQASLLRFLVEVNSVLLRLLLPQQEPSVGLLVQELPTKKRFYFLFTFLVIVRNTDVAFF